MTKTSVTARNRRRKVLAERYAPRRHELLSKLRDPALSFDERLAIYRRLRKLPRDIFPIRYKVRCELTGRARGNYRKFSICRNQFRSLALLGEIPGIRKASW
jgi:small subunit ribosomal protein S14